jgi:hypothetical protein
MNRKILKIVILILSLISSILCIFLPIYGKIKYNISILSIDTKFSENHFYFFTFNLFFCVIGIILFIRYLIYTDDKTFSDKYILLGPSIIVSMLIIVSGVFIYIHPLYPLILVIGSPLFLFFYINQKYNIIIKIILCLIFPINILFSFYLGLLRAIG